jgi:phosphate transport system protein
MTREILDKSLKGIENEILLLESMVEKATLRSVDALKNRDVVSAQKIADQDEDINEKRFAIENAILILIATQQPMARDLRLLAAMLEVAGELERMGDYAKGISKVTKALGEHDIPIPDKEIVKMATLAVGMLHKAITAFIEGDYKKAAIIPEEDDAVDDLYKFLYADTLKKISKNPGEIDRIILMLWVAHNLERLADRVTNICERTVFIATGELLELDSDEGDDYTDEDDDI